MSPDTVDQLNQAANNHYGIGSHPFLQAFGTSSITYLERCSSCIELAARKRHHAQRGQPIYGRNTTTPRSIKSGGIQITSQFSLR
jgi:hypothetical protein